jgi:hypothetical protein
MFKKIIPAIFILALASVACGFSVPLPKAPTPGADVTDQITVAAPTSGETRLSLSFGAGELNLSSGAKNLVDGAATYNVPELKPGVVANGNDIQINQGNFKANVTIESGASNVNAGSGWTQSGNLYTQSGSSPALSFIIKTGAGNLTLTH